MHAVPSLKERAAAACWAAFAADSLALSAHWVYDTRAIRQTLGRPDALAAPMDPRYHKNRSAGDLTHYGDQMFVLLESVAATGGFDLDDFFGRWRKLFDGYDGYIDSATRTTLERIEFGEGPQSCGSNSNDLSGASRLAALVPALHDDLDALVAAARAQAKMTHNNPLVLDAAEFFARAIHAGLGGASVSDALDTASRERYIAAPIESWLAQGREFSAGDTVSAVATFGQSCHIEGAFRSTVQIVLRHADDLREALVDNVMAGGDSAARGMLVGALLGAVHGPKALPPEWTGGLTRREAIVTLLNSLR
ncbi:ADP-ribosylglycohydrolase [Desulfobaculum xiamenense]|uniref:ADP-ribosylglycohydrolase n=1 Tax=Desulfobaculum xiamenense TaxID=995050 RepID=A0A846QQU4_9BACT|nr:ADP-ribosylglycohydrolase family protein [Desulfobaculum xiamenense]NJB68733.1 ADP-ribosylglycohydrolase [Desulfobaculum xiamenense]